MSCTILNTMNLTYLDFVANTLIYSRADQLLITLVIPIISIVGIIGNIGFVYTVVRLRRMRNSLNAYLGNLAVSDIMFLTMACFFYLLLYSTSPILYDMPVRSSFGCVILNIPFYFGHLASMGFITLISVERFYAICQPLRHRTIKTTKRTVLLVSATWITTIGTSFLLIPGHSRITHWCVVWPNTEKFHNFPMMYTICSSVSLKFKVIPELVLTITFILVLFINTVLNLRIIIAITAASRALRNGSAAEQGRNTAQKVALTLAVNTCIYFLCQTPYRLHTVNVIFQDLLNVSLLTFDTGSGSTLWIISEICLFINSAINPFVFAAGSAFYRRGFRDALRINRGFLRKITTRNSTPSHWTDQTSISLKPTNMASYTHVTSSPEGSPEVVPHER